MHGQGRLRGYGLKGSFAKVPLPFWSEWSLKPPNPVLMTMVRDSLTREPLPCEFPCVFVREQASRRVSQVVRRIAMVDQPLLGIICRRSPVRPRQGCFHAGVAG